MPVISLRALALGTLPAVLVLGACDRQSPAPAQPQSTSGASPGAQAGADDGASPAGEPFNGTLDIASRGAAMPEFTVTDPGGRKLSAADLRGTPVLINLWATWCGPCVLEMPMLDALAAKHAGKLRVVTVSQDLDGAQKVAGFFAQRKFARLEPWLDPDNALSFHYNTGLLPTSVLYDAKGREVWRMIGSHDWSSARTDALLADTLQARPG